MCGENLNSPIISGLNHIKPMKLEVLIILVSIFLTPSSFCQNTEPVTKNSLKSKQMEFWEINFKTIRYATYNRYAKDKQKEYGNSYFFDENIEGGNYTIYDSINDKEIHISETGSYIKGLLQVGTAWDCFSVGRIIFNLEIVIDNKSYKTKLHYKDNGLKGSLLKQLKLGESYNTSIKNIQSALGTVITDNYTFQFQIAMQLPHTVIVNYDIKTNALVAQDITDIQNLSGTNTGNQTSIAGITGTKAQFDTARIFDSNIDELLIDDNFIWFYPWKYSSREELIICRYNTIDGKLDVYNKENTQLPDAKNHLGWLINDIEKDSLGNIWFATYSGLIKYDKDKWMVLDTENFELPSNSTYSILFDSSNMWISMTDEGVIKYSKNSKLHYKNELPSGTVFDITSNGNNMYFSCGGGLVKFDGTNWLKLTEGSEKSNNNIDGIFIDKQNNIWIRGGKGTPPLAKYDGAKMIIYDEEMTNSPFPYGRYVSSIYSKNNNELWFGTSSGLLKMIDNDFIIFDHQNSNLPKCHIYQIVEDNKGIIWLGTSMGLYKYSKNKFTKINYKK